MQLKPTLNTKYLTPEMFETEFRALSKGNPDKIRAFPQVSGNELYGVSLRFCGRNYRIDAETFQAIRNRVFAVSKSLVWVTTDIRAFQNGVLDMAVLLCNHGYNPNYVLRTVKFLIEEVLPDLRTQKLKSID